MLLFYISLVILAAGFGMIAWLLWSEKEKEIQRQKQSALESGRTVTADDLLQRVGINPPARPLSEAPPSATPRPAPGPHEEDITRQTGLLMRQDELQTRLRQLEEKYERLKLLLREKENETARNEKALHAERRNRSDFENVKTRLEQEIEEVKDKTRRLKAQLTSAETEAQIRQKHINHIEEKIKKIETLCRENEDHGKDIADHIRQVRKRGVELAEKLKAASELLRQKMQKIEAITGMEEKSEVLAFEEEAEPSPQEEPAAAEVGEAPAPPEPVPAGSGTDEQSAAPADVPEIPPETAPGELEKMRNIGIIAHIDAGKTTTTERILFYAGAIHRMGTVDDGNTTMDWMAQEKERGITITSANITCQWKDKKINIIDTPGHVDFTVEVERSLKVLDGAVVVLCATSGVQSQTETVWRQADRYKVPRIFFINKIDRMGADFEGVIAKIRDRLQANAAAVSFPDGAENDFRGIVDLIDEKYVCYKDDAGMTLERREIPAQLKEKAAALRQVLIEKLSAGDEEITEKLLKGEEIPAAAIRAAIRRAVIANAFFPVLVGTALKNRGVQLLLDAIVDYLPSPLDVPPVKGTDPKTDQPAERIPSAQAPLCALVFKIASDPYVGKLFYTRFYSGTLATGETIYNSSAGKKERVSKIVVMHANKQEIVSRISAGEIVALVGLKETKSGHTICDNKNQIVLESMKVPEPVVSMAIEPKSKGDQDKMGLILKKFLDEDPSLRIKYDTDTGQTILSGMGELHLEIIIDRMKREHGLETDIGRPQVAYQETIKEKAEHVEGKFISQTGGRGQYGHCIIDVEPAEKPGQGIAFVNKIRGGHIPQEFIPSVEKGIRAGAQTGVLAKYPVTDITVNLVDGSFHEVDSSDIAFQLAAKAALREALQKGKSVFLEPIMTLECTVPEEFMGPVIGDLNTRRAKIVSMGMEGKLKTTRCEVPLSEMFNYANALRSLTQGRAAFSMEPAFYAEVPRHIADKIRMEREESLKKKSA